MLRKRGSFMRRECGRQIIFIVIAAIFVVPHLIIMLAHGNVSCPQRLLAFMALPRVFTLRFELTQYTWLAVDRVIATVFLSSYHKRAMVLSARCSIAVSFVMGLIECCIYLIRPYFGYYVNSCSIADGAGPVFQFYFFLVNMISYGIIATGTIIYGYEVTSNFRSNSRTTYSMVRLVFYLLCIFLIVLTVPSFLITFQQLTHLYALNNYTGFYDAAMNVMHGLLLVLFTVFGRQSYKIQASAASSTSMVTMNPPKRSHRRHNNGIVEAPVTTPPPAVVLPNVVEDSVS
uniref:Serpentine receptor class gamma n=2 Tax=Panagrellus redivivus TaxID=6233 RepID=A0A7E4ZRR4_PANRE